MHSSEHVPHLDGVLVAIVHNAGGHLAVPASPPRLLQCRKFKPELSRGEDATRSHKSLFLGFNVQLTTPNIGDEDMGQNAMSRECSMSMGKGHAWW